MPENWNFKLIVVLLLGILLIACGGGEKDPEQTSPVQVSVKSAGINLSKVSIDLNQNNSADVVLTRIFDDESETILNLTISWDSENLVLKDEAGNSIQLDYDKDLLTVGETSIEFKDPESNLDVKFSIEVIRESVTPNIQQYILSPSNITLGIGDSTDLIISVNMSDNTSGVVPEGLKCELDQTSTVINVSEDCQITALAVGQATVTLASTEEIDQSAIQKAIIIVSPPTVPVVSMAEIQSPSDPLIEGLDLQLSVKLTYSNDEIAFDKFDAVKCSSSSSIITITAGCKITALSPGKAIIELSKTDADVALSSFEIDVIPRSIVKLSVTPDKIFLGNNESQSIKVLADYNNGVSNVDVTEQSRCFLKDISDSAISVTDSCNVNALEDGDAEVSAELKDGPVITDVSTAVVNVSIVPPHVTKIEIVSSIEQLLTLESLQLSVKLTFSNGDTTNDDFDKVKCISNSSFVEVSSGCKITGISPGQAIIQLESLVESSAELIGTEIDVLAPSITHLSVSPNKIILKDGETKSLNVFADYNNGEKNVDVTSKVRCLLRTDNNVVNVLDSCEFTALNVGNAEITAELLAGPAVESISTSQVEVLPADLVKVEIDEHDATLVEGLELPLSITLTYSDGEIKANAFDVVKCISSSDNIIISSECNISAVTSGNASINLEMLIDGTPVLGASTIEIIPLSITQIRISPSAPRLTIGDVQSLTVFADYNDLTSANVTSNSICSISAGNEVITMSGLCGIEAVQNGNAEITATLKDNSAVDPVVAKVTVSEGLVLNSGENVLLDAEYFGGDANTKVSCAQNFSLGIDTNCEVFAYFPGEYEITATLRNITTNEFIATVKRAVFVNAVSLGDFAQNNEFSLLVSPNIYEIVYEISNVTVDDVYKITLADSQLPPYIKLRVLPDLTGSLSCANTVPAASFEGRVACGIRASSDKIYISLEDLNANQGLAGVISVSADADILQFQGPLKLGSGSNVAYENAYDFAPLTVGQTFSGGHVPANLVGLNVSRYYSNIDLGMNPAANAGNFYTVSITFESTNGALLANFDLQSVKIRWYSYSGAKTGEPDLQCLPQNDLIKSNTLSCTFGNISQDSLFVEVHGNGVDNLGLSNITAVDGEIAYSISLSQLP